MTDLPAYNSVGPDLDELTFLGDTELPGKVQFYVNKTEKNSAIASELPAQSDQWERITLNPCHAE